MNDPRILEAMLASIVAGNALPPGSISSSVGNNPRISQQGTQSTNDTAATTATSTNNTTVSTRSPNLTNTSTTSSNQGLASGDLSSLFQGTSSQLSAFLLQHIQQGTTSASSHQGSSNLLLGLDASTRAQLAQQGGVTSSAPTSAVLPATANSTTEALRRAVQGLYSSQELSRAPHHHQPPDAPAAGANSSGQSLANPTMQGRMALSLPPPGVAALPRTSNDVMDQWWMSSSSSQQDQQEQLNTKQASVSYLATTTGEPPGSSVLHSNSATQNDSNRKTKNEHQATKSTGASTSDASSATASYSRRRHQHDQEQDGTTPSRTTEGTSSIGSGGREERKRAANRISAQRCRKRKKEYIEVLKEENDELRKLILMLDVVPDLIVSFDSSGILQYVSKSSTEFLGVAPENLVGTSFWGLLDDSSTRRIKSIFMDSLARREENDSSVPLADPATACSTWSLKLKQHNKEEQGQQEGGFLGGLLSLRGTLYFSEQYGGAPRCVCTIRHRTTYRDFDQEVAEAAPTGTTNDREEETEEQQQEEG
eukprot:Nitzschia sp. Nitz4//scaffold181_size46380//9977//11590//NITZ4_007171-RA/size46380-processed-gene-0.21-mRNA-1//1//CDS//3329539492//5176//frame0